MRQRPNQRNEATTFAREGPGGGAGMNAGAERPEFGAVQAPETLGSGDSAENGGCAAEVLMPAERLART